MNQTLDENRLFSANEAERAVAKQLYQTVAKLPIISPHGHVNPQLLVANQPFANPAELFIYHDHYVTRMFHAAGFDLATMLGRTEAQADVAARDAWQIFCSNFHLLAGTASGYWLTHAFGTLFGLTEVPSADNAGELYEIIAGALATEEFLPRALFSRFGIEVLATTDDPLDDLADHQALAADPTFSGRVIPTFRPDRYLDPRLAGWRENVTRLVEKCGCSEVSYPNFVQALQSRRDYFIANGAVSADHGVQEAYTCKLSEAEATAIFDAALSGKATTNQLRDFAGHMLMEMARLSAADGLVMTLHAGVVRNHHTATLEKFGPDTGHDLPVQAEFTNNLRPMLEAYGLEPNLTLILFCLDESVWARDIAPLAGFYPAVRIGAPWWFLDAPDSGLRFREKTTEIAGFYRGSGFIDDTRAFLSIPARHDMARRIDSAYLARLVVGGRLTMQQALQIAVDLVVGIPKAAFKL